MNSHYSNIYDSSFYSQHETSMARSARTVLDLLFQYYKPDSVIDIGCGRGAWLAAAESLGVQTLSGVDGDWISEDAILSKAIQYTSADLTAGLPDLDRTYDLCLCLEVLEHLPESKAAACIDLLCRASDVVLFSAAVRLQGGTHHLNEQWQGYWIEHFDDRGYECIDMIRPTVWNDESVEYYYRQNTFLFVKRGVSGIDTSAMKTLEKPIHNMAHPISYERKAAVYERACHPTLRYSLGCLVRWARNILTRAERH